MPHTKIKTKGDGLDEIYKERILLLLYAAQKGKENGALATEDLHKLINAFVKLDKQLIKLITGKDL
jgi:hypothetical protein